MTFYVENETGKELPFSVEDLLKSITEKTLLKENVPFKDVSVNLTITDDASIRSVNKEYRNIDSATDVLSFPAIDFITPVNFTDISEGDPDYFDQDTHELILGDIMISLDHAEKQAEEYGHSLKREIAFLITHSLLHLLGYDHMEDDERVIMEEKQEEILNELGIVRE